MVTSFILFLLGALCYSVRDLKSFGKLKWMKDDDSFWGEDSHYRKYANPLDAPKDNWYYRFFKIGYKEKWFTSATLTVALTDSSHMLQFFFKLLFCAAFYPLTNWWFPVILWLLWTIVWNLCARYLTK